MQKFLQNFTISALTLAGHSCACGSFSASSPSAARMSEPPGSPERTPPTPRGHDGAVPLDPFGDAEVDHVRYPPKTWQELPQGFVACAQSRANTVARANNVSLNIARDQSSAEVAMGILPGFGAFGAPLILIHDNGKEFKGDFQEDINKYWTSSKVRFTDVHESEQNAHSSDGARYSSFVQMIKYSCKNL